MRQSSFAHGCDKPTTSPLLRIFAGKRLYLMILENVAAGRAFRPSPPWPATLLGLTPPPRPLTITSRLQVTGSVNDTCAIDCTSRN